MKSTHLRCFFGLREKKKKPMNDQPRDHCMRSQVVSS